MSFKKILGYYAPHMWRFRYPIGGTFLAYGIAVLFKDVLGALVYKHLFDTLGMGAATPDAVVTLSELLLMLVVSVVGYHVCARTADYLHPYAQSNVMKSLYDDAFARIEQHSYSFFANTFIGSLVTKTKRFVDSFETIHDVFVFHIWFSGISVISALVVLYVAAPLFAYILLAWLAVFIMGSWFFVRAIIARDTEYARNKSRVTGALADAFTNVLNIKMFARRIFEHDIFARVTTREESSRRRAWFMQTHQIVFQATLIAGIELVCMFLAVRLWVAGSITLGTVTLIQTYLLLLFDVVWNIGRNTTRFINAVADAQEAIEIFETPIPITDPEVPEVVRIDQGAITFSKVSFAYNDKNTVFDNLSLAIPAGQRVGLVGHSGAGKTTITKLLLRFSDVTGGSITIDGQDIRAITQDDLRRHISYVPQEPILFHRSLRENIAYGKPDATLQEVQRAAQRAHAHDFIERLSEGYDTLVGERGVKLSGGERQRVAIARAMLKDAPILILDEATSSLDSISERYIQQGFDELMKGRTTLVVAHRLSTIVRMDRILVFDQGTIVEDGTHDELLKKGGVYATLWKEQSVGFIGE
jgi:ATP-binding cassette subfamily B protein